MWWAKRTSRALSRFILVTILMSPQSHCQLTISIDVLRIEERKERTKGGMLYGARRGSIGER